MSEHITAYHTTDHPPKPTKAELEKYWYGRRSWQKDAQFARMNKKTGSVEYWWTAGKGSWGPYGTEKFFICKPRIKT